MKFVVGFIVFLLVALSSCGGFKGPKGDSGSSGTNGNSGAPGTTGDVGPAGPQGMPGTSVTLVALCDGDSVFPSTFVEYAFCVSGELYGTYSANGGFSTKMPPGDYASNGVNSMCNFTVGPNCQVTHE